MVATPLDRLNRSDSDHQRCASVDGAPSSLSKLKSLMEAEIGACTFFSCDIDFMLPALLGPGDLYKCASAVHLVKLFHV